MPLVVVVVVVVVSEGDLFYCRSTYFNLRCNRLTFNK